VKHSAPEVTVYRNRVATCFGVLVDLAAVVLIAAMAAGEWNAAKTVVAALVAALAVAVHLALTRPKVVASATGAEVVNPLRTYEFRWTEVEDVCVTDRIEFEMQGGHRVRASGTAESVYGMLAGGSRALKRVHEDLERHRADATGLPTGQHVEANWSREARRRRVAIGVFMFVTYVACMVAIHAL